MLSYTVTVLRANTVVVESNREREAAEANVRIALLDPMSLFSDCDGSAIDLVASEVLADPELAGSTRCDVVSEVSALNALGFQTPNGLTATQMGTTLPATLTGERTAIPEGTPTEDWWYANARAAATNDTIWLPDLPTFPSAARTSPGPSAMPYSMPTQYGCKVFLPGRYSQPLNINPTDLGTSRVYFASGVYYFEQPVTVSGAIDVIAGYGAEAFDGSECADDVQVGGNLIGGPPSFGIDGVGATFVFGGNGRLLVQNGDTGTGPSMRFNQRYGDNAGGGRISIMTVNGVFGDLNQPQLLVDDVVAVPRSNVAHDDVTVAIGSNGQNYVPSKDDYTSKPLRPNAPTFNGASPAAIRLTPYTATSGTRPRGVLVEWDDVTGTAANGALVTAYTVTANGSPTNVCPATSIVSPEPGKLACFVGGLGTATSNANVTVAVTATNIAGESPATQSSVRLGTATLMSVPSAIDPVAVVTTPFLDALKIDWPAAAHNGSVVTGYDVVVERVYEYVPAPVTVPTVPPAPTEPTTTLAAPATEAPSTTESPADSTTTTSTSSTTTTTLPPTTTTTTTTTVPATPIPVVDGTWTCAPRSSGWTAVATDCIVRGLALDTTPGAAPDGGTYLGFRITVTPINGVGVGPVSAPTDWITSLGTADAPADSVAPARSFTPRVPTAVVEVDVSRAATARVSIPGYVSVPMGRLSVKNTPGHDVRINGGILASTFDVTDGRAGPTDAPRPSSLPIGYINDIVLQRTVRVSSTVDRTTVVATVQVNETGEFAVNSWTVS
jgi:hypothetical protein